MINRLLILTILIGSIFINTGCSTTTPLTYVPSNQGEPGYYEKQKEVYKWMVGTYFSLSNHTPQQAANIMMRRASEIASKNGFEWMRVLNYDTESRHGSIGALPATISINKNGYGTMTPGRNFYGNLDAISPRGFNHAVVEYFEFSRKVDCDTEKCETTDFFLERCNEGWDGGTEELISMCKTNTKLEKAGLLEACIDRARYVTKDFCITMDFAAYKNRGMIEERNLGDIGAWHRTEDILQKYTNRSAEWATK